MKERQTKIERDRERQRMTQTDRWADRQSLGGSDRGRERERVKYWPVTKNLTIRLIDSFESIN